MNNDITLSDIFGIDDGEPPKAHKQTSGLKLAGAHMHSFELGGREVQVPSQQYVTSLENQIRELRRELRLAETKINRLATMLDAQNRKIGKLETKPSSNNYYEIYD